MPHPSPSGADLLWKRFTDLSLMELYGILRLRAQVFVLEQQSFFEDADGLDPQALHLLATGAAPGEPALGTLRVLESDLARARADLPHGLWCWIGRVVTRADQRGSGLGRRMMQAAMAELSARFPDHGIALHAQTRLEPFYRSFGFERAGPDFDEDGVAHCLMLHPGTEIARGGLT